MKAFWWLAIAALAVGAWYFWLGGAAQLEKYTAESAETKQSAFVTSFEEESAGRFVSFTDPYYGFEMKYPIGYQADFGDIAGPRLSARAEMAENLFEVIQANAIDEQFASAMATMPNEIGGNKLANRRNATIAGKDAVLFDSTGTVPLAETATYGRWAVMDCAMANGTRYTLVVTGIVSAPLASDLGMIDYVIYSVRC
ncbi:hypothetical protein COT29_00970 [Candidatus Micrarchaeota archaeon CG08_land_8_20_14_0_20_59_11]|nr:MAG: hypothetical protein COT29_00970 [Candidatus Micrarchaeota archaeon CG08_land_8_20_14_0_20_59_11]